MREVVDILVHLVQAVELGLAFGQNGPLALVFALLAIEGLRRDEDWLAGLGVPVWKLLVTGSAR